MCRCRSGREGGKDGGGQRKERGQGGGAGAGADCKEED